MADLQLTIRTENLDRVRQQLARLSGAQAKAAYANAIEDTAKQARKRMQDEMKSVFDRPTPWMLKSVSYQVDRGKLTAQILPTYSNQQQREPQKVLRAQAYGGQRRAKGMENVLRRAGLLPAGWFAMPGQGARLDSYGNVSAGQVKQVMSQLQLLQKGNMASGKRGQRAQQRAGGRFFVVPVGSRGQPGIYQRGLAGRSVVPIFIFASRANYQVRFDLDKVAHQGTESLQAYLDKRIRFRIRNLAEGKDA